MAVNKLRLIFSHKCEEGTIQLKDIQNIEKEKFLKDCGINISEYKDLLEEIRDNNYYVSKNILFIQHIAQVLEYYQTNLVFYDCSIRRLFNHVVIITTKE